MVPKDYAPRQLSKSEAKLYQNLRSDRMIRLARVPAMLGLVDAPACTRVLISQGCPIYRLGRQYHVFSGDVVAAVNQLDIVHNQKWNKQLDALYRKGVRPGFNQKNPALRRGRGRKNASGS